MQYKTEYSVFRDYDLAQEECREFLEGASGLAVDQYGTRYGTNFIVIFENEQSAEKPYFTRTKLKETYRAELFYLWKDYFTDYHGYADMTKTEMINDLLTITRRQYYAKQYEQNGYRDIEEYDFKARGYNPGDIVKVCNADDMSFITSDYICNILYDTPIQADCVVWKRENSDNEWTHVDVFYLSEYTDAYKPSYDDVYQSLLAEKNPLAHLVAYDMPRDIFENVE